MEALPYMDFINHFKLKKEWAEVMSDANSPILRLLTKGDVFFKRKIIAVESPQPTTQKPQNPANQLMLVNFEKDKSRITTVG